MDALLYFENLDKSLTLWLNSLNSPVSDQIWIWFSNRWIWVPLYLLIIALLIKELGWKRGLIAVLSIVLCILCVDQLCNVIKNSVERLRPCNDPSMIERGLHMLAGASTRHPYGFFSAHAANAMAFAVASYKLLNKAKWKCFLPIWAVLVGLSRVFVGKHFLADVLVGFIAGALLGAIFAKLFTLLFNSGTAKSSGSAL